MTIHPQRLRNGLVVILMLLGVVPFFAAEAGATVDTSACTNTPTVLHRNDDSSSGEVNLPFSLNYFGEQYTSLYVNNNGNVTLDEPMSTYVPFDLKATDRAIIAPFFADVDTRPDDGGTVTYCEVTSGGRPAFRVHWKAVGYYGYGVDKKNDFGLLLIDRSDVSAGDFDIKFEYNSIEWDDGDASRGQTARVGYANGSNAAGTFFEAPGSGEEGKFLNGGQRSLVAAGTKSFAVRNGVVEARGVDFGPQQDDRLLRGCSDKGRGLTAVDSDGDGILDKWEDEKGIDYDGDGVIDLQLPGGIKKNRPDILVYVDWDNGAKLSREEITDLRYAFISKGVGLFIAEGREIPVPGAIDLESMAPVKAAHAFKMLGSGPLTREAALLVYHYGVLSNDGGGEGEIWGDDFTAGNLADGRLARTGAFMHELGHNLGLMHGGINDDHTHNEPNHFSVMNYIYQSNWNEFGLGLTYSHGDGYTLNENDLNERDGVRKSGQNSSNLRTKVKNKQQSVGVPIRYRGWWGIGYKPGVKANLNIGPGDPNGIRLVRSFNNAGVVPESGSLDGPKISTLDDADEWGALRYCFRGAGSYTAYGLSGDGKIFDDEAPKWDPNPMIVVLPDGRAYLIDDIDANGDFNPEVDGPIVRQEFQMSLPNGDVITLRTDDYGAIIPSDGLLAVPESGVVVELVGDGWTFGEEPAVVVQEATGPDGGERVFGDEASPVPTTTATTASPPAIVASTTKPKSVPDGAVHAPSSTDDSAPSGSDEATPSTTASKPAVTQSSAPQRNSVIAQSATAKSGGGSGPLARTGTSTWLLLGLAMSAGLGGVALVAASRKRR